jgi:tetratricopeptide (TPR) repeat protein
MTTPQMHMMDQVTQNKRLKMLLISAALVILILIPYGQVKNHDFVNFDDPFHVSENQILRNGFTLEGMVCPFTDCAVSENLPLWHPITWLSLMLDYRLYGLKPAGYLLTNLLLHVLNTLILFFILNHMTRAPWRSAFVAALFAVHPLHVESVAWVSERKDVLSTFWGLLTIVTYLYHVKKPALWKYILMTGLFSLALMSKSMLVTLPFALLLLDFWPLRRFSFIEQPPSAVQKITGATEAKQTGKKRSRKSTAEIKDKSHKQLSRAAIGSIGPLLLEKVPLLILSLLSSFITFYFHQKTGGIITTIPFLHRLENAILSYATYLFKSFCPINLAVFYPFQDPLPAGWTAVSAVLLLFITAGILHFRNRKPYLLTGWFWYIGTLVPVIGIVQAGNQAMADRYTYIPLIGLSIIVAWGTYDLLKKWPRHKMVLTAAASIVLATLVAVTWKQVGYWKNSLALFEHAIAATQDNYLAHHQLGMFYADRGNVGEAIRHASEAVRLKPGYALSHIGLGNALLDGGKLEEAEGQFRETIRLDPHFQEAFLGIGRVLQARGRIEESKTYFQKALNINPKYPRAYLLLGDVLSAQGKTDDAMACYRKAAELNPDYADAAYNNMGIVLRSQGRIPEALSRYREAIRLNPRNVSARMNMGNILVSQGQIEEGIGQFREVVRIDPGNTNALNRLGSALLIQGKTAEAVIQFRKVLGIQPRDATALQALQYVENRMKAGTSR